MVSNLEKRNILKRLQITSQYINKQIKINSVTLTHKDFSELFQATNEQLLIRFRNYWATQQQQKRTVKRRYYKNLIVVFSYRILSFFTFTPPIQNTPWWTVNIWTNEHWEVNFFWMPFEYIFQYTPCVCIVGFKEIFIEFTPKNLAMNLK